MRLRLYDGNLVLVGGGHDERTKWEESNPFLLLQAIDEAMERRREDDDERGH